MAKSDQSSSDSDTSEEQNKRMPDEDYPGSFGKPDSSDILGSDKSLDVSHLSESVSERLNRLSDVCGEMDSDMIGRSQSNENSESGSGCHFENYTGVVLRGQDPACSSPQRDRMKSIEFGECVKRRTQSGESTKSEIEGEKTEVYKSMTENFLELELFSI